jgi:non-lysosomal glucosylceramidase
MTGLGFRSPSVASGLGRSALVVAASSVTGSWKPPLQKTVLRADLPEHLVPGGWGRAAGACTRGGTFRRRGRGRTGSGAPVAGLPRFRNCHYEATYPFGRAVLSDKGVPVRASVEVFNPLVPGDEEVSGLPIAIITVVLESDADQPVDCSVMFSCEALTGHTARHAGLASRPVAERRSEGGVEGYFLSDESLDPEAEEWGSIALAALGEGPWTGPTWGLGKWNQGISAMWRGFMANGMPDEGGFGVGRVGPAPTFGSSIAGTVGARKMLPPRGRAEVVFLMGWHFPNRRAWAPPGNGPRGISGPEIIGNFYAKSYRDAWDVVAREAARVPELRRLTEQFVNGFWSSDLPVPVKEAALFNLSTLRSQTFFRDGDGNPLAWEGCMDDVGSCFGSCTHVWNYELATPFVWGGLARRMREIEYLYATAQDGAMSFRTLVPLDRVGEWARTAADGQFGCVVTLYREWRLSGDDAWLARLWPARRVLRPQPDGAVVVPSRPRSSRGNGGRCWRTRICQHLPQAFRQRDGSDRGATVQWLLLRTAGHPAA